jgi:hypothetical protein
MRILLICPRENGIVFSDDILKETEQRIQNIINNADNVRRVYKLIHRNHTFKHLSSRDRCPLFISDIAAPNSDVISPLVLTLSFVFKRTILKIAK